MAKEPVLILHNDPYRAKEIFNRLPGAILVTDQSLNIIFMNTEAERLLNTQEEIHRNLREILPHEWDVWLAPLLNSPVDKISYVERLYRSPDGKGIFLGITVSPLFGDTGNFGGAVFSFQDVTVRKSLERDLLQAQKLESVGRLSAGIAHELNTPIQYVRDNTSFVESSLKTILSFVDKAIIELRELKAAGISNPNLETLLLSVDELDLPYLSTEVPAALSQTTEGAESVARIVRSLKDFSHRGTQERVIVDINNVLKSTVTVCRNEWKYVADVVWNIDEKLPRVSCYPGELNQVFLNIVINAAHAIEEVISRGRKGKGTITICTRKESNRVIVSITDTGTGIPEGIRSKIYDPFFTTKPPGKGTGQGLALAYQTIVEHHQGSISFDSKENAGTTFNIELPIGI